MLQQPFDLNDENFITYAAKVYENPNYYTDQEFYEDLNIFKYVKRLLKRYDQLGILKERLILNHLIILYNIFGFHATKMLFFKLEDELHKYLKPFLVYLNKMPDEINSVSGKRIISSDIEMDQSIIDILRETNNRAS
jgi:hypothetical protein